MLSVSEVEQDVADTLKGFLDLVVVSYGDGITVTVFVFVVVQVAIVGHGIPKSTIELIDDLVLTGAKLLAFAICRDADDISGVDLDDHDAFVPTAEGLSVLERASVEAIRASDASVVAYLASLHP
jgi:hypothetical protein